MAGFQVQILCLVMLSVVVPADYSKDAELEIPQRCVRRVEDCGPFHAPQDDVGTYDCWPTRNCAITCSLKCPSGTVINNPRHSRHSNFCSSKTWRVKNFRRPYCQANTYVPEVRQNLHLVPELNKLSSALFNASYFYLGMATFYERADVALPGFSQFMLKLHVQELDNARGLMSYVNRRGGYVSLHDIPRPSSHDKLLTESTSQPGLAGVSLALTATKDILSQVMDLQTRAANGRPSDPHLKQFLKYGLMTQKTDNVKELADLETRLGSFTDDDYHVGEFIVDKELH